MSNFDKDFKL